MVRQMERVGCCVAGGGPAGMMLGYLLARAGVRTVVLEKHADFLRDFRGDTVHPSTLDVMHELGLLDEFLHLPHQRVHTLRGVVGGQPITLADFSHTPTRCHFIALMPQWHFLNFLAAKGRELPHFSLCMNHEVTGLVQSGKRVTGLAVRTPAGEQTIEADLVVGANGRHSLLREAAQLPVQQLGSPIDVLWLKLARREGDPTQALGFVNFGRVFVTLDRGDYWQCAFVIRKGEFEQIKARGLAALHAEIVRLVPQFHDRVDALTDWEQIKLLTVTVDRLRQWWRPGFLCIGDAAHAMSPIGGVGINLAIQDAVAAARLLAPTFAFGPPGDAALAAVQQRREWPTRLTQSVQVLIQGRVISRVLDTDHSLRPPWALTLFNRWPRLRRLPARLVGVGVRPEHISGSR